MSSAPTETNTPSRLFIARIGARVALAHALAVVVAFALAGYLAQLSVNQISQGATRDRIRGEYLALVDKFHQEGSAHLPYTVAKHQRLWRGFDYRMVDPSGRYLAGRLPPTGLGWRTATIAEPTGAGGSQRFMVFTDRMPDGAVLSVGQNLAAETGQTLAIDRTLLACGALGVLFCVGLSYLANRGAWRRVAAIAGVAEAVAAGDLKVRAASREAAKDDIDQLGVAFNLMLDRINLLIGQVRQVSTDIAHDLRTPLTRHRQRLERLRAQVRDDPSVLKEVQGLETDVAEILRTFDALLQLSEIEVGEETAGLAIDDLGEIAARVAEAYRPDIEESGRLLTVSMVAAPVLADQALLTQAIANLLENALRHTQKGAAIFVSVAVRAGEAELVVRDDGPGVPAGDRQAVLRPFVRLEPSRRHPGSGLGLSIVAAIAARHGARLILDDAAPGLSVSMRFAAMAIERTVTSSAPDRLLTQ